MSRTTRWKGFFVVQAMTVWAYRRGAWKRRLPEGMRNSG